MTLVEFVEVYVANGGNLPEPKPKKNGFEYSFDFNSVPKSKREYVESQFRKVRGVYHEECGDFPDLNNMNNGI
jgi:hypothetical protein